MSGESIPIDGRLQAPRTVRLGRHAWKYTDEVYNARWIARVTANTVRTHGGCWLWQGSRARNGYGHTGYRGDTRIVHRKLYEVIHDVTLDRWVYVCHRCDVKLCCNPDHLWIGTPKDNMHDRDRKGRQNEARKTHCKRGHPLSGGNVIFRKQGRGKREDVMRRVCRTCERIRYRIALGWTEEEAATIPVIPPGTPTKRRFTSRASP